MLWVLGVSQLGISVAYLNRPSAIVAHPTQIKSYPPESGAHHFFVERVEEPTDNNQHGRFITAQVADAAPGDSARRWPQRITPHLSRAGADGYFDGRPDPERSLFCLR